MLPFIALVFAGRKLLKTYFVPNNISNQHDYSMVGYIITVMGMRYVHPSKICTVNCFPNLMTRFPMRYLVIYAATQDGYITNN